MRLFLFLAAALSLAVAAPGARAADHKAGLWFLDADEELPFCMGSTRAKDGAGILTLVGSRGAVMVAVTPAKKVRRGDAGVIATDGGDIAFVPEIGKDNFIVAVRDLTASQVAMLSRAKVIRVIIDGALVLEAGVENSGIEDVLTGAVACSKGESGWWGKGAVAEAPEGPGLVYPSEGATWGIVTENATCLAQAAAPDDHQLQLPSVMGRIGLAVGSTGAKLPRGRKVQVQTDSYSFEFKPEYSEGSTYMNSADLLESADVFALRRAKSLRMTVDGRTLLDVDFEGDSFLEAIDAVTACSRGEKGWWGEGAKPPAS
jgi:hypothetical protein